MMVTLLACTNQVNTTYETTTQIEKNENGKYVAPNGKEYDYCLELSGTMPNAARSTIMIVYTDDKDLTFEKASKSIYSSNSKDTLDAYIDFIKPTVSTNSIEVNKKMINQINDFAYQTIPVLSHTKSDNFNYSPASLYYALAITGTGAKGETQRQILHLLNVKSKDKLSIQCNTLYNTLSKENKATQLKLANSIWLNEKNQFKESFVSNAEDYFHTSTYKVDFANDETGKAMARWISEHTKGTLNPNIKTDPRQILSIINTIYFCDQWVDGFDKNHTQEEIFHTEQGDVKADFMNQTNTTEFIKGRNFTRATLRLKGNGQMVFILPDEEVNVRELISSKQAIKAAFEEGKVQNGEVRWKIPKINYDTTYQLKDPLITLGVINAFNEDADFSGMTHDDACISQILQQAHIAVDENGVEASAFTRTDIYGSAKPKESIVMNMNLDRPFLYGIVAENGILLFVGVCNNPSI